MKRVTLTVLVLSLLTISFNSNAWLIGGGLFGRGDYGTQFTETEVGPDGVSHTYGYTVCDARGWGCKQGTVENGLL